MRWKPGRVSITGVFISRVLYAHYGDKLDMKQSTAVCWGGVFVFLWAGTSVSRKAIFFGCKYKMGSSYRLGRFNV